MKTQIYEWRQALKNITLKNCAITLLGSFILAFGLYNVHSISGVTEGGVLGATLLLEHWTGISPAFTGGIMNILCYILGWKLLGKEFIAYSALAIDGCCPKFLFFPMRRRILMQLTYTGEDFEYHFGRPLTLSRCKWKVKETNKRFIWHFKAQNRTSVVRISGSCSKEQMMPLLYESPDGKVSDIPLWEGGNATGTIELYRRIGGSLELIDRLQFENGLCAYQRS